MKLEPRRVEAFLRDPGAMRAVLLYGDDVGLVRERGLRLTRLVAGSADDPFRVAELDQDASGRLVTELASLPLTGGRRVVRVRDATDSWTTAVAAGLAGKGGGLLILEALGLAAKSRLRALIEKAADAVAIGCYPPDDATLASEIRAGLQAADVGVDGETLRWLQDHLGGDRAVTRREIDKLALYVGPGAAADIAAARACVGDLAGLSLDDALFAATAGQIGAADRALEMAFSEGATAVGVARAGLLHVQRLHRARLSMAAGASAAEAISAARPAVFYRRLGAFQTALSLWSEAALTAAAARLWDADRNAKQTGLPGETIVRSVILGLAQRAAGQRR